MRLFIAINFSDEIRNRILEIQDQLRSQTLSGNFTRSENFHLTLVFLGETPEEKLDCLFRIMEEIHEPPFEISFNCSGCFSNRRRELWWIGADQKSPCLPVLVKIHKQLLDRLLSAGFPVDTRPFKAHITIGREIERSRPVVLDFPGIKVKADRISLMKSEHIKGKLCYTEIFGKVLAGDILT